MRLPTHAPVSWASPARRACFAALLALALGATPALATHYVVDINGGGDFTTIQAAIDAHQTTGWRDTVLVMPGNYAESLVLGTPSTVIGVNGPGATSVEGGRFFNGFYGQVEGLEFNGDVALDYNLGSIGVERCVFRGTVEGVVSSPMFIDCDFCAPVTLLYLESYGRPLLVSSRFHGAPVTMSAGNGMILIQNCSFEGPADTLLQINHATQDDQVVLSSCRFENANYGVVVKEALGAAVAIGGTFRDLAVAGIWYDNTANAAGGNEANLAGGWISGLFERCGTAIHWRGFTTEYGYRWSGVILVISGATILDSAHDGIDVGPLSQSGIYDCRIDGSGGTGAIVRQEYPAAGRSDEGLSVFVTNSIFANNRGSGLVISDTAATAHESVVDYWPGPDHWIRGCTFSGNDGRGLDVSTADWSVENCTALANGSDGFAWSTSAPSMPSRLSSNTSVLNRGDGYRASRPVRLGDSLQLIQNNLSAMNAGAGFRMPVVPFGSLARNDAWNNYLAQYAGAWASLDSNLVVDARFCDLSAGVAGLGLEQGSPCGPSGVYGLIGARPEECPNTAAVGAVASPALAFSVRPSIARGAADFVPPATGGEGVVELFDVAGRVVWSAPLGPATGIVRWRGEGERGHVRAGLYWVRFTRGSERTTQRLVWLE